MFRYYLISVFFIVFLAMTANSQSSSFTYQGKLTDNGLAANGNYEMQFSLFDGIGNQVGVTFTNNNVSVNNGIFTVQLTFGILAFDGNPRFLEIGVRPAGSQNPFTILAPRQSVLSAPYSVRSLFAGTADLSLNSNQLGGIAANQYVLTGDARLSDARNPLAGSGNYIQNSTNPQTSASFNITGNGFVGGILSGNSVNTITHYSLGGVRFFTGTNSSVFAGINSGINNVAVNNAFFGGASGQSNTTGANNAFFGFNAGNANNGGGANTFIGVNAGIANVGSVNNTFLGANAGNTNLTGNGNTYLGANSDGGFLITNSVAIGQKAFVGQSNSLVLGSINGVNTATADTNVGIGTATPQTKLHIKDNVDTSFTIESSSSEGAGINLHNPYFNQSNWRISAEGAWLNGALRIINKVTDAEVLRLEGTGQNGQIRPQMIMLGDLQVYNGYLSVGLLSGNGSQEVCRNGSGYLATCSSSLRYKNDIQPFTSGLSILNLFNPVTFRWKSDGTPDLGFVAEDVAKIDPLLVTFNANGEVEGVKYDRISAVLVNAVKEQQAQIEEQKKQIDELKSVVCSIKPDAPVCKEKQQ